MSKESNRPTTFDRDLGRFREMDDSEIETARAAAYVYNKKEARRKKVEKIRAWEPRIAGGLAVALVAAAGVAGAHNRLNGDNDVKEQSDQPPIENIQEHVEMQTQENEIHKALHEGKDPSEIVINVPADMAQREK
ncbi:MAG: hypothetical protein U0524_01065 [Candidatus Saccharimonadales bacterium]